MTLAFTKRQMRLFWGQLIWILPQNTHRIYAPIKTSRFRPPPHKDLIELAVHLGYFKSINNISKTRYIQLLDVQPGNRRQIADMLERILHLGLKHGISDVQEVYDTFHPSNFPQEIN